MKKLSAAAALAAVGLGLSAQANAALVLNTSVTSTFTSGATGFDGGMDMSNQPSSISFGQLGTDQNGVVDFYYVGSEASYGNTLWVGGAAVQANSPQGFAPPDNISASLNVTAGQFLDFGFCTTGGDSVGAFGRCAYNNNAASLTAQFNYIAPPTMEPGYRTIGFRALTAYDPNGGLSNAAAATYAAAGTLSSSLWAIFWDDSGRANDDDFDDFIAVARFRPQTAVPEPGTLMLLGTSMIGFAALRRRRSQG